MEAETRRAQSVDRRCIGKCLVVAIRSARWKAVPIGGQRRRGSERVKLGLGNGVSGGEGIGRDGGRAAEARSEEGNLGRVGSMERRGAVEQRGAQGGIGGDMRRAGAGPTAECEQVAGGAWSGGRERCGGSRTDARENIRGWPAGAGTCGTRTRAAAGAAGSQRTVQRPPRGRAKGANTGEGPGWSDPEGLGLRPGDGEQIAALKRRKNLCTPGGVGVEEVQGRVVTICI